MKAKAKLQTKIPGRYLVLLTAFVCMFGMVAARLGYLHVVKHDFLRTQGEARTRREVKIAAYRGIIKDRNGESLAISTPVDSVWINPQEVDLKDPKLKQVAKLLDLHVHTMRDKVRKGAHKEFVYLRRHIDPKVSKKIQALQVAGIHLLPEYKRYYPTGEVTAPVLGTTNVDDRGLEGLELAYNTWLQGKPGKKIVERDRLGREVELLDSNEVQPGKDLVLSLDSRLQFLAYKALRAAVTEHNAISGSAVVLDVKTGEVLAMVNDPSFNPNRRERDQHAHYRNAAVTDAFEPGSVLKTFSMAGVLERTKINPNMVIDTSPGYIKLAGGVVREDHYKGGTLEFASILKESSNVGITKLVLNLKPQDLVDTYTRMGFGEITGSGFPGESAGYVTIPRQNQSFVMATMSFGYGVSVTPLQLAQAYAIIGAGGIKRPVSFLKLDDGAVDGIRVLKPNVARQVLDLLSIAADHDRSNARVSGYRVAGKTGTARKLGKDGLYDKSRHRAMFGGLAPAINPRVAIVVAIDEPRSGACYGNQVAAPVFSRIASGALRLFKVAPDLLDTHGVHVASSSNP
ncbi:MAG TPA: penicillin-binding transpeptidase domain-containing protein, partial [Gammaproteobacteria bacterium]|nr:penicillin-binding transpeptidase domain-containing protein [Gammaproteobacteria bacterium]